MRVLQGGLECKYRQGGTGVIESRGERWVWESSRGGKGPGEGPGEGPGRVSCERFPAGLVTWLWILEKQYLIEQQLSFTPPFFFLSLYQILLKLDVTQIHSPTSCKIIESAVILIPRCTLCWPSGIGKTLKSCWRREAPTLQKTSGRILIGSICRTTRI